MSVLLTGPVFAQKKPNVKTEAALISVVKQMVDAQSAFDVAALEKITTADYIEISPLGEFDPREKMLGFYKPELKPKNMEIKNDADEFSIRDYGKFAIVIVRLNFLITMDGKTAPPRSMRATYVCRKEKDAWKIASAHYTGIHPPAPAPAK
ncbi:MAG TPA: nuclear transport factor 2 family protein [Pyrinomonadaceae bacterium]|jgi:ketosteroid isomerase-like protein|nr:nuclear transport factor 2 family protein [Pyrinomonadaceae bacterium]